MIGPPFQIRNETFRVSSSPRPFTSPGLIVVPCVYFLANLFLMIPHLNIFNQCLRLARAHVSSSRGHLRGKLLLLSQTNMLSSMARTSDLVRYLISALVWTLCMRAVTACGRLLESQLGSLSRLDLCNSEASFTSGSPNRAEDLLFHLVRT